MSTYDVETFSPSVAMAAMQTTMINANMTAYSVAVAPCSSLMKVMR